VVVAYFKVPTVPQNMSEIARSSMRSEKVTLKETKQVSPGVCNTNGGNVGAMYPDRE
jgi:hypothetical protein